MATQPTSPGGILGFLGALGHGISSGLAAAGAPYGGIGNLASAMMMDTGANGTQAYAQALQNAQTLALKRAQVRQQMQAKQLAMQRQRVLLQALTAPAAAAASQLPIDQQQGQSSTSPDSSSSGSSSSGSSGSPQTAQQAQTQAVQRAQADGATPRGATTAPLVLLPQYRGSPTPVQRSSILAPATGSALATGPVTPEALGRTASAVAAAQAPRLPGTLPSWFTPPTAAQIASVPIGGMAPQTAMTLARLEGKTPAQAAAANQAYQLAYTKQRYSTAIATLDTIRQSDDPVRYVQASPGLMAAWQRLAPQLGLNPQRDMTNQNVRTALTYERNRLAGDLQEATVAPTVPLQTIPIGLGGSIQRNPLTGKITPGASQQPTAQFVMPDGSVRMMTKAAGIRAGYTPFNAETYTSPQTTGGVANLIAHYEMPPLSNYALARPQGQAIMAAVKAINPKYDATQYATKSAARIKFATGKQGDTVRSLSVADSHLDMLSDAAQALAKTDVPALNRIANSFGVHVLGATPQTNFDAMRQIVSDEVVKAIVGSGGAESDREEIRETFDAARSPKQIQGVIQKYQGLLGGQLRGLKRQYQKATGLDDFDYFVSSMARSQLNQAANQALGHSTGTNPGAAVSRSGRPIVYRNGQWVYQ